MLDDGTIRRYLADLRGPEIEQRITAESIIVQPLGAVEQHGPHLPLSTDLVIAQAVAEQAVSAAVDVGHDVWLLPPLAFTKSNEHAWAPGTMWLSARTMLSVLEDLASCVAMTNARRLVFINGHGGNSALLSVVNREIRLQYGLMTFLVHPFVPADQGGASAPTELGMGVHGGFDETSVMLHLRPDLVDMGAARANVPEWMANNTHVRFGGRVPFGWLSNDFGPDGHIGDPTAASAEEGQRLFRLAVASVSEALGEIATFEFPKP
jgi:creatinine amidohydrolase